MGYFHLLVTGLLCSSLSVEQIVSKAPEHFHFYYDSSSHMTTVDTGGIRTTLTYAAHAPRWAESVAKRSDAQPFDL